MLKAGCVVKSMAGHDKNKFYVIVKLEGDCVYIADGRARKLGKPKRKNVKHVRKTNMMLDLNIVTTDKKLRQALGAIGAGAAGQEGGD